VAAYSSTQKIKEHKSMYQFKLPDVGEGIHEAELLRWLVEVGDTVKMNQVILEIQTDKAVVEIPSPVSGTVSEIKAEAGTMAHVGDVLITIDSEDAPKTKAPAQEPKSTTNGQEVPQTEPATVGIAGPGKRVLAAPAVRKMALEMGVNLADVPGTGPAGRVLPDDVKNYVEAQKQAAETPSPAKAEPPAELPSPAPQPSAPMPAVQRQVAGQEITEEEPLQGLRRRIAERMELAWEIPHVTSFEEIEVDKLVALRKQLQPEAEQRGTRLTYLPFVIKAVVQALKEFPYFNASLDMDRQKIIHHRYYHIGVATAVPDGLLVPIVRHADQMNLIQLAAETKRLAELAQERKLGIEQLSGSTFTITNFGSYGGRMGTPIINHPEVAILGTGRIEKKAIVEDDEVVVRFMLPLALSYDHRLLDGAAAGQFLRRVTTLLTDPNLLLLELV
jgi:pyruvate dehydrogenase E2 component (dihydrolipoamide acetyltransferase)